MPMLQGRLPSINASMAKTTNGLLLFIKKRPLKICTNNYTFVD